MIDRKLITTPFDASSTADDVVDGHDLRGVRAIVTGASSGLGRETARVLMAAGADVTLAVRDVVSGERTMADLAGGRAARAQVAVLDLAEPRSVQAFVDAWHGPLHLLVNNAGVVTGGLERTRQGWERQLATNHLGHFALATGLRPALVAGSTERGEARIVTVSSTAHMRSGFAFDDPQFEKRAYDPQIAYAQSKTANSLFSVEAFRRWVDDGVVANTVNPGGIRTGLQRHFTDSQIASLEAAEAAGAFRWKSVEQGAATTLVACVVPALGRTGGHYLDDCQEAYLVEDDATLVDHPHGVKRWALDPATATRLWEWSERTLAAD